MSTVLHRSLDWRDAGPLYVMRCDTETARWSFKPIPTWSEHLRWLNKELTLWPPRTFIGITPSEVPISMVAVRDGEINVMVNPEYRKEGFGVMAVRWACTHFGPPMMARIMFGNTAGLKLFRRCGFDMHEDSTDDIIVMEWQR